MQHKHFNNNWKGGKTKHQKGYVYIRNADHPRASNGYVFEHRLIMEQHIGRYLTENEVVHHKNGVRDDNRIQNLELCSHVEHISMHHKMDEDAIQKVIELYNTMSITKISQLIQYTTKQVNAIALAHGLKRDRYDKPTDTEEILQLFKSGLSLRKIAAIKSLSHIAIRNRIIRKIGMDAYISIAIGQGKHREYTV